LELRAEWAFCAVTARRPGIVVLVVVAAILATGCGGSGGRLGAKSLAKQSETVQSLAAEGALLARDSAAGRSTSTFRREHSSELAKAAASAATSLRAATTTPELRPQLRELRVISARVSAALGQLGSASQDEQRTLARRLDREAKASEKVGGEFG
jgi:hypothetical protein